jgi:putative FmdB family regulatory protein
MPLYEYRCTRCDRRFEQLQAMGAGASDVACPACGAGEAERLLSTFAAAVGGSSASSGAPSFEGGGCGLPQCGGGRCAGADWN